MKIKIEADLQAATAATFLMHLADALKKKDTAELLKTLGPGEHFKMDGPRGAITITKL